jgi:flagellar biosynthetic protein FlhB
LFDSKDESEKTEQPTPRRLEKARERGEVPKSPELAHALFVLAAAGALALGAAHCWQGLAQSLRLALGRSLALAPGNLGTQNAATAVARQAAGAVAAASLPLLLFFAASAIAVHFVQTGPIFALARLSPRLSRLDPKTNLARIVSKESLFRLLSTLAKLALLVAALVSVVRSELPRLCGMGSLGLRPGLAAAGGMILGVLWRAGLVLAAIGTLDLLMARRRHAQSMRMTRQEVKEEQREEEGSPEVKARQRKRRPLRPLKERLAAVKRADVVLTNPTSLAVAIGYDRATMAAPRVLAKGRDRLAARIRAIAREEGIALVENPPLARALYRGVEVGGEIPPKLYRAVAEVLAFVYRLRNRSRL